MFNLKQIADHILEGKAEQVKKLVQMALEEGIGVQNIWHL
jgi:methanogenic corrinoid protein MtbC1